MVLKNRLLAANKVHCPIGDCDVIVKSWSEGTDTVKCPRKIDCKRSIACAYGQLED